MRRSAEEWTETGGASFARKNREQLGRVQAIVVAPSRELAMQIMRTAQSLLPPSAKNAVQQCIGGANVYRQVSTGVQQTGSWACSLGLTELPGLRHGSQQAARSSLTTAKPPKQPATHKLTAAVLVKQAATHSTATVLLQVWHLTLQTCAGGGAEGAQAAGGCGHARAPGRALTRWCSAHASHRCSPPRLCRVF